MTRTPPKVPRPGPAPLATSPTVARLAARLSAEPSRREELLGRFWADAGAESPLVEEIPGRPQERIVTFLWRDAAAEAVLLFANRITDERRLSDSLMERLPGTDVWHLSYRMSTRWRASYAVVRQGEGESAPWLTGADQVALRAALDHGLVDVRNPRTSRNRRGVLHSVVELPEAPAQPWLDPRDVDVAKGTVVERRAPGGRRTWIYESAGGADRASGLAVVLDGDVWTSTQDLPTTLDNLVHDAAIGPVRVALLDSGSRERRWSELGDPSGDTDELAHEFLDWARSQYPIVPAASGVAIAGQSLGGLTALRAMTQHPDRFGAAISQSASLWLGDPAARLRPGSLAGTRAWVEVGSQEWVLAPLHPPLVAALREAGTEVRYTEYDGGHDDACWRGGLADALCHLFPPP